MRHSSPCSLLMTTRKWKYSIDHWPFRLTVLCIQHSTFYLSLFIVWKWRVLPVTWCCCDCLLSMMTVFCYIEISLLILIFDACSHLQMLLSILLCLLRSPHLIWRVGYVFLKFPSFCTFTLPLFGWPLLHILHLFDYICGCGPMTAACTSSSLWSHFIRCWVRCWPLALSPLQPILRNTSSILAISVLTTVEEKMTDHCWNYSV